jgi:predicted enzyme related to lactoylglutathione lyase
MATREDRGRFIWYDLMTSNPDSAIDFYTDLIGWGTQEWEGGDQPYTMFSSGENPIGGVMDFPPDVKEAGVPPHWMAYVAVDDVAATAERAKELGGEIMHPPTDIPGAGSFAVLGDPQGAVLAVYHSAEDTSSEHTQPGVGKFSWHELATTDFGAAYDFYADLFGWEKHEAMDMGDGWIYQIYGKGEMPYGGMFNKPDDMPGPPMWLYYISVPSVDDAVGKVKELGGQVLNGPMDVPGGDRVAQCVDPQGAMFALHSLAQ